MTEPTTVSQPSSDLTPRQIGMDDPWSWLAAGWRDLWLHPRIGLTYGLVVAVVGGLLFLGLFEIQLTAIIMVLGAGFMLLGPLLAVGLYEASRRIETGEPITFRDIAVVSTRSPVQLAFLGLLLALAFLAWIRIATLLFALFFGAQHFPPIEQFVSTLLFTWHGLTLLITGSIVGGGIAFCVFMMSAVSVPLLMAEDRDALSAVIFSIRSVIENPKPMILWAWLIAILTAVGLAIGFVGLIVTFPLIGHATWHAFRALRGS